MTLTAILIALAALTGLNWYLGKTFLYPPATFAGAWLFYLSLYAVAGNRFLPISERSLLFFLAGAVMMTLGGFLASFGYHLFGRADVKPRAPQRSAMGWPLSALVVLLVAAFPFYVRYVLDLVASGPSGDFWFILRNQMISSYEGDAANQFHGIDNLVTLAAIVAMIACWEEDGSAKCRIRMYASALVGVLYQLGIASRSGAVSLLLALFAIRWLKKGKPSRVAIVAFVSTMLIVVFAMAWLLQKGDIDKKEAFVDNIGGLYDSFLLYAAGPPVAFDKMISDPTGVPPTLSVSQPLLLFANKFGARFETPPSVPEFTTIGRIGNQNAYTMYFSYVPEFGFAGALLLMVVLGAATTVVFISARHGNGTAAVLCGFFFASAILSAFAEYYLLALNFIVKIALLTWLLYLWERARTRRMHSVQVQPAEA
jgi:oligosaccharide repeat unit polymerase